MGWVEENGVETQAAQEHAARYEQRSFPETGSTNPELPPEVGVFLPEPVGEELF
jgi:hypothetical protein